MFLTVRGKKPVGSYSWAIIDVLCCHYAGCLLCYIRKDINNSHLPCPHPRFLFGKIWFKLEHLPCSNCCSLLPFPHFIPKLVLGTGLREWDRLYLPFFCLLVWLLQASHFHAMYLSTLFLPVYYHSFHFKFISAKKKPFLTVFFSQGQAGRTGSATDLWFVTTQHFIPRNVVFFIISHK